jgi:predicted PurR-regulated permease PerM
MSDESQHPNPDGVAQPPARPPESPAAAHAATPIWISRRTRSVLIAAGIAALLLLLYLVPTLVVLMIGGWALAFALSFPVRWLSPFMPRGLAILIALVLTAGVLVVVVAVLVPILVEQLASLIRELPGIARQIEARLPRLSNRLAARGLLPDVQERILGNLQQGVLAAFQSLARRILGGLGQFVSGAVGTVVTLFGIVFVAVYLLADARRIRTAVLCGAPRRYRHDVNELWNAFSGTLSRYLGGLALSIAIQGLLSAIALYVLGVPYAIVLGLWVSITALVPYVGAWIGAIPAVLLALAISPTRALLTAGLFALIQQLEGNVLTPRIQSQAVRVPPLLVFLAVFAGGSLFGIPGVIFAVPAVAMVRVLFDFFRARLRTLPEQP